MSAALSLQSALAEPGIPSRLALVAGDEAIDYRGLAARVASAVSELRRSGVGPGARIGVDAAATPGTVLAIHALMASGATIVPVHPRLTSVERSDLLRAARVDRALSDVDTDALWRLPPRARTLAITHDPPSPRSADAPLALVPTSGTSGSPKLVVLSASAFSSSASACAERLGSRDDDRWLCCMPLCHVGGLSILTRCLAARSAVVVVPRFDPHAVLHAVTRWRATVLSVVPTMLRRLLDEDASGALSRLRAVIVGGAATPVPWLEECARRGIVALTTYGLTEACSMLALQSPARSGAVLEVRGDVGLPLRGAEIAVAEGHIRFRGPLRMSAYLGEPALCETDWLDTGDLGWVAADGSLHVDGRRTDLIVTGGENVSPVEVERVVAAVPGISEAMVFGVDDDRWGEVVAAAIVVGTPSAFDEAQLAEAIVRRLAPHKRPRRIAIVGALPRTAAGKPDRRGAAVAFGSQLRAVCLV